MAGLKLFLLARLMSDCSTMANALAASLAPSAQDSVGARILKKMGWRIGQGVGPRLTYEQRRKQDLAQGVAVTEDEEDEEAKKHMYPRRDTPLLLIPKKENTHGLGYKPGVGLMESLGAKAAGVAKGPNIAGAQYYVSRLMGSNSDYC